MAFQEILRPDVYIEKEMKEKFFEHDLISNRNHFFLSRQSKYHILVCTFNVWKIFMEQVYQHWINLSGQKSLKDHKRHLYGGVRLIFYGSANTLHK